MSLPPHSANPALSQQPAGLRILVATVEMYSSGGMLRFERIARCLRAQGHSLSFCCMTGKVSPQWPGTSPVLSPEEAAAATWDATLLPGRAGFDLTPDTLSSLAPFRKPQFGLRVQFVLNDTSYRAGFLAVNRAFQPQLVVFNNHAWTVADFPDFLGAQFHFLEGGVDLAAFQRIPLATLDPAGPCWIGGQARKNSLDLAGALRHLPPNFRMRLFGDIPSQLIDGCGDLIAEGRLELVGPIEESALPAYYAGVDIVVTPELVAGWSNTAAEAAAAGRPLVCTASGTGAFARHGETAVVIGDTRPLRIAQAVLELHASPSHASRLAAQGREAIAQFDWHEYSNRLIELLRAPPNAHYFYAPEAGLYGKWPLNRRTAGLDALFAACTGCSVLDIGAAEGLIAERCLQAGARQVDGVELDAERVQEARRRNAGDADRARFFTLDLNQRNALKQLATLLPKYDIVLYLGVHHHLDPTTASGVFDALLRRTGRTLYMRTSETVASRDQLVERAQALGFTLTSTALVEEGDQIGALWEFTAPAPARITQEPVTMTPQFVSYPKSGRTWIRYVLFQLGYEGRIQFHHDGFEFNDGSRPPHDFDLAQRRARYATSGPVVFLVRDPRAVMVSLYHQVTGRFKDMFRYEGNLSDFLRDPYFGADVLARFRNMWTALADLPNIRVVSYEDCHADLGGVIESILQHFGLPIDRQAIAEAVANSTLERMRAKEETDSFSEPWLRKRNGHGKVRIGSTQGYRDELSAADIAYLDAIFKPQECVLTRPVNEAVRRKPGPFSPIIVLGMHRCGTSATAGLLTALGLDAGAHLFQGNEFNQKGYFEDSRVVGLHDKLLTGLGSSWKDLRPLPEGWLDAPLTREIAEQLRGLISDAARQGGQWVLKDPRMCKLLPLWLQLLRELKLAPRFVLPVRNPDACAASLHARDELTPEDACALWLMHVKASELGTRGFRRSFVAYEALLEDWRTELARLESHLTLKLDWQSDNVNRAAAFISPELNHAPRAPTPNADGLVAAARTVHRRLMDAIPAYDPAGTVDDLFGEIDRLLFEQAYVLAPSQATAENRAKILATHASGLVRILDDFDQRRAAPVPRARQQDPDFDRYEQASARMKAGQVEEAAGALIELASSATKVGDVYVDLAHYAQTLGDVDAAGALLDSLQDREIVSDEALLRLANLQTATGRTNEALVTIGAFLRRQPNGQEGLALLRHLLGMVAELSPISWARLLADLRYPAAVLRTQLDEALDTLSLVREHATAIPTAAQASRPPAESPSAATEAASSNDIAIAQNPRQASGAAAMQTTAADQDRQQVELARSLIAQEQLGEAAEILTALVLAETPLFEAYYDLGCLAVRQGDVETAVSLFGMALERDPESVAARRNLALAQGIEQHYEDALATLSPILRSGHASGEDYGLVRDILGKAPLLGPIAWARLLSDLRTPSAEQKKALDEHEALVHQLAVARAENERLRAEVAELRGELRHLAATPSTEARTAAWQQIHALPDDDWLNVLIRSVDTPSYRGFPLPGFPAEGLQTGIVGSSNESALREGFNFYRAVKALCADHGHPLGADTRLLDFGTGWGRYSRIFMKEIAPDNITGVDVDPSLVQVCRSTFPYCNFEVVPPFPPTELGAGQFDLVIAYSVFSHLSEAAATAWIEEFARILAPGGMIAITTQGRRFIDYCEHIRRSGEITHPWHLKLAQSFTDVEACQAAYERGEFLYSATGGGDARPSSFYGEALVPPGFVERVWSRFLEPVAFIDDGSLPQALIVMRKPR